jgi:putative transposase
MSRARCPGIVMLGADTDDAKRLKELEQENSKLKRLVAELSLDKQILQDIARGNF